MFKKVLSVFVVVLMSVFAVCLTGCGEKKDNVIVIGGMGPLTGAASVYGEAVYNSAKMAVEEINAAGGLKNGIKLQLEFLDDAHDATKVANNYYSLKDQKGMQVALGCVTTKPCLEFKNLSKEDNLFFITPSASADTVVEYDNAFQMCFADGKQGTYAANYVNANYDGKKIGVFYCADDEYSSGIYNQFTAALNKTVTVVATSFVGEGTDFATQVATLAGEGVEFVFMPIYYTPASLFMKQAKNVTAFSNSTVFYGCDGFDGIDSMEGFDLATIPQEVSMLSHFNSKAADGTKAAEFVKKYTAKYGTATLNQFGASAYDCVYAIVQAMNEIEDAKPGTITADIAASELNTLLKAKFTSADFKYYGVTGAEGTAITWAADGFVNKVAVKYTLKEANK